MKHQRAALMHEVEEKKKLAAQKTEPGEDVEVENVDEIETVDNVQWEGEENEEEIEYVVERLETDEDELDESQMKAADEVEGVIVEGEIEGEVEEEEEKEEEEDEEMHLRQSEDEEYDDNEKPLLKKIKLERMDDCRDTLAEAMAHVHGEYLEEPESQGGVQLEMVVESEDHNNPEMQVVTVIQDTDDADKEPGKESRENGRSGRREIKIDRKTGKVLDDSKSQADSEIVMACPLPILGTAYQINSSVAPTSNTIGVLQPVNTIPIAPAQSKTITLTSGGKTLTLTGGTFQPGTQYVLSKLKGKPPTLVMADKKSALAATQAEDAAKSGHLNKEQLVVASTSQQGSKKHVLLKPVKSPPINRKPRISTHVVDTSKGLPVGGLQVSLYKLMDGRWTFLNESITSPNGRCSDLADNMKVNFTTGRYKIHFDVDKYFTLRRIETMYPFIEIVFDVKNPAGNYHMPVLLSPFGYMTYRGSER